MTRPVTLLLSALLAAGAAAADPPEVAPGGVVTWPGQGVTECSRGDEWYPARDSVCWYPIDLLEPEGVVTLRRRGARGAESTAVRIGDYAYPVQRITLQDDSKVNLSAADLARVAEEQRAVGALWSSRTRSRFELPLSPPLAELPAGGRFGHRRFFNDQPRSPHSGADYAAVTGTPVLAVAAGRVAMARDLFFSGNSVFIDHGDGLVSMYFHLSEMGVAAGDEVERGQVVGEVGATGRATGPHLHFGVRWRGARVDPRLLLGPATAVPSLPDRAPSEG